MLRGLPIGQFIPGTSPIHRMDPRAKIAAVMLAILTLFIHTSPLSYAVMTLFVALAVGLSGVSPGLIIRGLRPVLFILLLTVSLHLFLTRGEVLFTLGPLVATREGLRQGILMGWRIAVLIAVTSLLTLTTSPISLTDGLEALLKPWRRLGVPAHELAMMMTIALRFIPTLMEEADKVMKAQMARGADFASGNLLQRARSLIPLLVPLFVGAFRRADELALAMEARGYRGGDHRTRLRVLRATYVDAAALAVTGAFSAVVIYLRFWR